MSKIINDEELKHSASHVLAMAVKNIYPTVKLGIGPAIEDGFYYDFDFVSPVKNEDLEKIEQEMARLIKANLKFEQIEKTRAEAKKLLQKQNEPYKIELLKDIPSGEKITFFKLGNDNIPNPFTDLCAGPHITYTPKIKAFKLTKITGAYWRGKSENKMLTRIYGVAFRTKDELVQYELLQEEIKRRDHNKIGRELEIFASDPIIGQGLPLLLPNGTKIIKTLQRFVEDEEEKRGYMQVMSPDFTKSDLFKISGHWQHYKDGMFVIGNELLDEEVFALKPMTCPFHATMYKQNIRSYRDLPIRYSETAKQYRNENSGEMHGLVRVRQYTLSDGHVFCRPDQVQQVFDECLELCDFLLKKIGLHEKVTYRLSKWDIKNKDKYIDNPIAWEDSQEQIRKVLTRNKMKFYEADGEAAFYGPKIDIQIRNVHGKEDTLMTVQLDFALAERYDLSFIDENGQKQRPFIVHRGSLGAYERVLAFLIEHYAGAFPTWLSPVQAVIMGITNKQDDYVNKVFTELKSTYLNGHGFQNGLRIERDIRPEKVGFKIREHTKRKIPYLIIVGEKEQESNTIAIRTREGTDLGSMSVKEFIETIIKSQVHKNSLTTDKENLI
ncbi:MAG: threonine--tRNA ligase [Firmicutes bacterium]|nr:threonine--tRNA ligase [Bacillota bacterium]